jgi:small subunit ribosomal protein S21e
MQNEQGKNVDLYVPRKCHWTSRLVVSKDHAAVQINVAHVDPVTGIYTGTATPICIAGYVRFKCESDWAITTLSQKFDQAPQQQLHTPPTVVVPTTDSSIPVPVLAE